MPTQLDNNTKERIQREALEKYPVKDECVYGIGSSSIYLDTNQDARDAYIAGATKERERAQAEIERLKGLIRKLWESKIVFKKRINIEDKWQQFKTENNL